MSESPNKEQQQIKESKQQQTTKTDNESIKNDQPICTSVQQHDKYQPGQAQSNVQNLKTNDCDLSDQQQQKFKQNCQEKANQCKIKGNDLFREGNYQQAILQYQQGLKFTNESIMRATLYSNMAVCFIKNGDFNFATKYCKKALKQDESHRKARINLARCYEENSKIQQAFEQYKKIQQNFKDCSPQDVKFVKQKIAVLQPKIDQINETRKKQVLDGLKGIGNSVLGYFGMSLDNFKLEQGPGGGYNISFKQ